MSPNPIITNQYIGDMVQPGDAVIASIAINVLNGEAKIHLRIDKDIMDLLARKSLACREEIVSSMRRLSAEFADRLGVSL